jgi:hypothetical protein
MKKFKDIVVMADFSSTGLWRKGKKSICGLMIEYEDLGLSKNLIKQFKAWANAYDKTFIGLAMGKHKTANKFDVDDIVTTGRGLATILQSKFPETKVWYYFEDYKGKMIKRPVKMWMGS